MSEIDPNTGALIVALPDQDDPVSTQVHEPHVTMLWFGPGGDIPDVQLSAIREAVQAAASVAAPFDAKVSGTAKLGDDDANVLLLEAPELSELRELLQISPDVTAATGAVEQFPQFMPHLTVGYPGNGGDNPGDIGGDEIQTEPHEMFVSPPPSVRIGGLGLWNGENREIYSFDGGLVAAAGVGTETLMTPDTSDVKPIFLALTDAVDQEAVLDVLALVPASATNSTPVVYSRGENKTWVPDPEMRMAMLSTTPPPIAALDEQTAQGVIDQVDAYFVRKGKGTPATTPAAAPAAAPAPTAEADVATPVKDDGKDKGKDNGKDKAKDKGSAETAVTASGSGWEMQLYGEFGELYLAPTEDETALVAAGGVDQNRGNAERLRRYWTVGPGAAKIRWGQGGDWYRCVKHLSKYLGPRAKGYCQLRHKEATGIYTSTHAKRERHGRQASGFQPVNEADRLAGFLAAGMMDAAKNVAPADAPEHGARFRIPVLIPEGVETGDGRSFIPLSVTTRDLPLPLLWQISSDEGHNGSVVVGRIDSIDRIKNGLGNATGVFDVGPYGQEAERLVRGGFLRGVSADLDKFEAVQTPAPTEIPLGDQDSEQDGDGGMELPAISKVGGEKMLINKARVSAATLVAKPAFEECTVEIIAPETTTEAVT